MSSIIPPGLATGQQRQRTPLPLVRQAALPTQAVRPLARILVSDDDPALRTIYAAILGDHGFEYLGVPAGNGRLTLELARRAHPHLLVTDSNKPELTGPALRAALRADPTTAHLPILTVSAMDPWREQAYAERGPLDDYFMKPFLAEALIYRVAALLPLDAAAHDTLVEQARRLPCYEHYHPVTGLPCFHSLARALPDATAKAGWSALGVSLAAYPALVRTRGRTAAEALQARLGGIIRTVTGANLLVAHTGFDPQIALVGPAPQVAAAAASIVIRFEATRRHTARHTPSPRPTPPHPSRRRTSGPRA